jgi:plastocyanin
MRDGNDRRRKLAMNIRRRTICAALGLLAASAALIPTGALGGARAASTHTVTLRNFAFHPATLSIHRGDRVKWLWRDEFEHNVTFHGFHSHTQVGGSYTVRFTHAGTFKYKCSIHFEEGMRGKIVVH